MRVDRRGDGRVLRVDGTYASWYEPGKILSGPVWNALAAPLCFLPPARRRSVLVLGLGGGSAARVVRALAPGARIVGVELDRAVLRESRRWFDLDALALEVVADDAQRVLGRTRRRFDVVIDDVFVGRGRAVRKPPWLPSPGLALAARRVAPGGLLVSNTLDDTRASAAVLRELFPSVVRIGVEDYDNRILVGGPRRLDGAGLRRRVEADPLLGPAAGPLVFRTLARPG